MWRRRLVALLVAASAAGCATQDADLWKKKFREEVEFHSQTQQAKNAEIAALQVEVENQRNLNIILWTRVTELERKLREKK